jgi:hypothetical protein
LSNSSTLSSTQLNNSKIPGIGNNTNNINNTNNNNNKISILKSPSATTTTTNKPALTLAYNNSSKPLRPSTMFIANKKSTNLEIKTTNLSQANSTEPDLPSFVNNDQNESESIKQPTKIENISNTNNITNNNDNDVVTHENTVSKQEYIDLKVDDQNSKPNENTNADQKSYQVQMQRLNINDRHNR